MCRLHEVALPTRLRVGPNARRHGGGGGRGQHVRGLEHCGHFLEPERPHFLGRKKVASREGPREPEVDYNILHVPGTRTLHG